jgi:methylenetetrahydrofolate dehydrogenase (NADP+)/methenyltetrahydrofolate cyclohydrolase
MKILLDGKKARDVRASRLATTIATYKTKPTLTIFQVGDRAESSAYIRQKVLFAEKIGAQTHHVCLPLSTTTEELISHIAEHNLRADVHGIIVQLPLPPEIESKKVLESILPEKDVDGLSSGNTKALWNGQAGHVPATARGVLSLLSFYDIPIAGTHAVVVGRSNLVGKPTALALLNAGATVTVCHRGTKDIAAHTANADIVVLATGNPKLFGPKYFSPEAVVVDVGISVVEEGGVKHLVGDVDFDAVEAHVAAISPVPGGVGPMTVLSLFENLLDAYRIQCNDIIESAS